METPTFRLQLSLLLWKNFTVKRRHPILWLFEICIPLTLFICLVCVRSSLKIAHPIPESRYGMQPLPSTGVIPVLQSFCSNGASVYESHNSRLEKLLEDLDQVFRLVDPYISDLTPQSLEELPILVKDIADSVNWDDIQGTSLNSLIHNHTTFENTLRQKFAFSTNTTKSLLHTNLNTSKIGEIIDNSLSDTNLDAPSTFQSLSESTYEGIDDVLCDTSLVDSIFLTSQTVSKEEISALIKILCSLPQDQQIEMIKVILQHVDLGPVKYEELMSLLEIGDVLSWLAPYYPAVENLDPGTAESVENLDPGTAESVENLDPGTAESVEKKVASTLSSWMQGFTSLWSALNPVICGTQSTVDGNTTHQLPQDIVFNAEQEQRLGILAHIFSHNPKILFAPNNTAALRIIRKVNDTISIYSQITMAARVWQNMSANFSTQMQNIKLTLSPSIQKLLQSGLTKAIRVLDGLSSGWLNLTYNMDFNVFHGFQTEHELEHYFLHQQNLDNVTVIAGLVFENLDALSDNLPSLVRYKIRQNATLNPPTNKPRNPIWFPSPGSNNLLYYDFGFVWIQDLVERAVIDLQLGKPLPSPGTFLHRMPYPCYLFDSFVWLITHIIPLCLMLSWVYPVAMLVQRIVYEKEKRLKEVMKMMGLSDSVHWWAWFLTATIQMTITVLILTLMLYCGRVLPHTNPAIMFVFLELFAFSSIAFSFLVSSLYSRAKLAAACAGIFYFMTYVPYMYISVHEDLTGEKISAAVKTIASLLSTTALGLGGKYFMYYELEGSGLQWNNFMESPREQDEFNLLYVFIMMGVDTILYFLLAWYIENIHPGTYGIPKPWYYPFTCSYWCGVSTSCSLRRLFDIHTKGNQYTYIRSESNIENLSDDRGIFWCGCNSDCSCKFEAEPRDLTASVVVSNLRKTYSGSDRPALDGLNMKLFEDQITAFLGHNGAGKTTTMSILTGLFPPSSGSACVYGRDIRTEMDRIRQDLGMCPQHNVLFDSLTVEEHMWFYSRLKGVPAKSITDESQRMLKDLTLQNKGHCLPGALSGGMQRKLSIGIAFVGGARTVILDEPTAGVDPYSRRAIWNLLTKYKTGRTVMVSTHHLDEAERLGDRALIIADGKLKCAGSPTFLKSHLGDGFRLCILKNSQTVSDISDIGESTEAEDILALVRKIVPSSHITKKLDNEIQITVPITSDEKRLLIPMFRLLEEKKTELGIKSYGITDCGLEQVFVKVTKSSEKENQCLTGRQEDGRNHVIDFGNNIDVSTEADYMQLREIDESADFTTFDMNYLQGRTKRWKFVQDFKALLLKRLYYTLRNRKALLSQIILPAVFASISMTIALSAPKNSDPEPMAMSTSQYYNLTHPTGGNFVPFSMYSHDKHSRIQQSDIFSQRLAESLFMPSGIGPSCTMQSNKTRDKTMNKDTYIRDCREIFTAESVQVTGDHHILGKSLHQGARYYPECQCRSDKVRFECNKDGTVDPPRWKLITGDVIQNITSGRNDEEEYFLYTTQSYRGHRYGGFTFGGQLPYIPSNFSWSHQLDKFSSMLAVKHYNKVWFNKKGYHSMPIYLNAMNNALLRTALSQSHSTRQTDPSQYGILLTNHPMKKTNNLLNSDYIQGGTDVLMAVFIIIAMSFVPASFVVLLVHERTIKAKHLQFASGLHPVTYWLSNYFWDMCNYMIPAVCIIGILLAFQIDAYVGSGNLEAVIVLFLLYGWSITPMMYPASFLFKEPSVAYICMILVNLFTGITCVISSFMLKLFEFDEELSTINKFLSEVFLIFPNYCLGSGMMTIALNHYEAEYYSHVEQYDKIRTALNWNVTGKRLVVMAIMGVASFVFTLLCQYQFFLGHRLKSKPPEEKDTGLDADILSERDHTLHGEGQNGVLTVERLHKVYRTRTLAKIPAVKDLTFSVPKGECFGLLGVNGAGKTTTFRMLTGDLTPSSGDAKLLSQSVVKGGRSSQQCVGYCPQFDAVFSELTAREHLQLYARLRQIPVKHHPKVIDRCLRLLGIYRYGNQAAGTLSGGNKRKLSTAIALIGNPSLILMDEPTSGMDPYSRRFLWDVIQHLVRQGMSVVFSSHSMEECETLCSRLTIMAKGQLKCLGSVQHLKEKYGNGYTLTVTLQSSRFITTVKEYIENYIPATKLKYRGHRSLIFDLKIMCSELGDVYKVMEDMPVHLEVLDYSLNQNSLDNVFINFATEHYEEDSCVAMETDVPGDDNLNTQQDYIHDGDDDEPLIELHQQPVLDSSDDCMLLGTGTRPGVPEFSHI